METAEAMKVTDSLIQMNPEMERMAEQVLIDTGRAFAITISSMSKIRMQTMSAWELKEMVFEKKKHLQATKKRKEERENMLKARWERKVARMQAIREKGEIIRRNATPR
jgi:hypothetical protein